MHYACALPDASDIEDTLAQAGADETAQDDVSSVHGFRGNNSMDLCLNSHSQASLRMEE